MGVLQRFERRLEGMVEGAFARAFRSELQPVEVASAVQREMDDRAAIVAKGRTLVPNDFVVELADSDYERLDVYAESLGVELANLARDYAKEQGYSFVGPGADAVRGRAGNHHGHVPDPLGRHPGLDHRGWRDQAAGQRPAADARAGIPRPPEAARLRAGRSRRARGR